MDRILERILIVVLTIGFIVMLTHELGWWPEEPRWYKTPMMPDTMPAKAQKDSTTLPVENVQVPISLGMCE